MVRKLKWLTSSLFLLLPMLLSAQDTQIKDLFEKTTITDGSWLVFDFDSSAIVVTRKMSVDNFRLSGLDLDYSTASWIWNPNQDNRDLIFRADTITTAFFLESSSGYFGFHEDTPIGNVHITDWSVVSPQLILENKLQAGGASTHYPIVDLYRNQLNINQRLGLYSFSTKSVVAGKQSYGGFRAVVTDTTDASEDVEIYVQGMVGGITRDFVKYEGGATPAVTFNSNSIVMGLKVLWDSGTAIDVNGATGEVTIGNLSGGGSVAQWVDYTTFLGTGEAGEYIHLTDAAVDDSATIGINASGNLEITVAGATAANDVYFASDIVLSDGDSDSPGLGFRVQSGTQWSIAAIDASDDLFFLVSTSSSEQIQLSNSGPGQMDLLMDGDLTVQGDDITMANNTSGYILIADGTDFSPGQLNFSQLVGEATLAQITDMEAYTIRLRNAATSGDPANVKISSLTETTAVIDSLWIMSEDTSGALRKLDIATIYNRKEVDAAALLGTPSNPAAFDSINGYYTAYQFDASTADTLMCEWTLPSYFISLDSIQIIVGTGDTAGDSVSFAFKWVGTSEGDELASNTSTFSTALADTLDMGTNANRRKMLTISGAFTSLSPGDSFLGMLYRDVSIANNIAVDVYVITLIFYGRGIT